MLSILLITFPFFALVACGFIATWRGMLPTTAISGLNSFVLYFALPCMLFRFGAQTPVAQLLEMPVLVVYLIAAMIMVLVTVALTRRRMGWNDAAFGALVAAFPNTGFMGVPMLVAILGAQSAGTVIVTMAIDMVVTTSVCIALSRLDVSGAEGMRGALSKALKGMCANPMPWSIVLGGVASALGWSLPGPMDKTVTMLAAAASPVALFTIGAVLARSQMNVHERVAMRDYVPIALAKLLLHPLLIAAVAWLAMALGLPLSRESLLVLILVAALPSASNVSLLTERYGADSGRIARIILVSTSAAFLSFSAVVALMV